MRLRTLCLAIALAVGAWTQALAQDTTVTSPHGDLAISCADCHQPLAWKPARITNRFDHGKSGFPLEGAHAGATCISCHGSLKFGAVAASCATCHRDFHRGELGANCARCHTSRSFTDHQGMYRAHQQTRFPLQGPHAAVDCQSCHVPAPQGGLTWVNRPTECQGCHLPTFKATTNPSHVQAAFPKDCLSCHAENTWQGGRFDHRTTQFTLAGAHMTARCQDCHGDGVYKGRSQTCVGCHQKDYDASVTPPHKAAGFPSDCTQCHSAGAVEWKGATFDHGLTRFALTGAHQAVVCKDCHQNNVFRGTSSECVSCHRQSFDKTVNPSHPAAGFPTSCTSCHNTTTWKGASFDHNTTGFPLTGAHIPVTCQGCHADGVYKGKNTACVGCHQKNFDQVVMPDHKAAAFSSDCTTCHNTTAWKGARYDHSATQFPLTGAHQAVTCASCHADGVYKGKSTLCVSCHQRTYDATTNPNHRASGLPTTCTTCHSTTSWQGASFDHGTTQFPLTGAHRAVTCVGCHADGVYAGKSTACASCHQAAFDASVNPNHRAAAFPTTCTSCHSTTAWRPATWDHNTTQFPLTGAHRAATCQQCHADGVYRGKSTACVSCHQQNYDASVNPNHRASGFPTTCATCHNTTAWQGATFDHNATQFPLTGAHRAVTCVGCHADGVYAGKSTACLSCHQPAFDASVNPNHRAAAFPTTCTTCHNTTAWRPSTWDHGTTQFPLTGAHRTVTCQQCHADGVYRGKSTACVSCHQQAYDGTTNPNHRSAGFPTTCTTCHNTTAWQGATFDHNATQFPLTGAHRAVTCQGCHADGVYVGKSTACVSCHQQAYDASVNPNHRAAAFPTSCTGCHNTTAWRPASWDHGTTQFPLTGAHRSVTCQQCHGDGVYVGKSTACVSCHQQNYDASTNPNHRSAGFPTTCTTCHNTTAWQPASFDHGTTQFPLTGAHLAVNCLGCHADGVYAGKSTACVSCHQRDYNASLNPPHLSLAFPTDCASCHTTTGWPGGRYDHSTTQFPLTGAHLSVTCRQCHGDGVYRGKSTDCVSCHLADFNATTDPSHVGARFPTTCTTCHNTTAWAGARFDHDAQYFRIYSGHHQGRWRACSDCHTNNSNYSVFTCLTCHTKSQTDAQHVGRSGYSYTSSACYSCHRDS